MADNQIKFELDLDSAGFKQGVEGARLALETMAKTSKSVEGSLEFLKQYATVLAGIYATYKLIGAAVATVFAAEDIKAVNQQFELLSKNSGIVAENLKAGLVDAAGGLADDTDLLHAANRGLIAMGESAAKIPEIMTLARKATSAFGGDLVQNFEGIIQAVSTGNTRMLKQMGIVVNADEAMRNYAATVGKSIGQLTDAERRQATLNAVIDKGRTSFAGISDEIRVNQNLWKQIQVTVKEIGEVLTLAFDKTFGPILAKYLQGIREMTKDTKTFLQSWFGEGAERAEAQATRLKDRLMDLKGELVDLDTGRTKPGIIGRLMGETAEDQMRRIRMEIKLTEGELASVEARAQAAKEKGAGTAGPGPGKPVDTEALVSRNKFESDLLRIQEQQLELAQKKATSEAEFNQLEFSRKATMEAQKDQEIAAEQARLQARLINEDQFQLAKQSIELKYQEQQRAMEMTETQRRLEVYENELRAAQNVGAGISAAFRQGAASASADLRNFGKQGQMVFNSFQNNAVSALQAWGAGTKSAAEAAKGFALGMIADIAESYGRMLLLQSIWPPNPAGFAAGAGLIALSGFLRAQAGGGAGAGGSAGGGAAGGFGGFGGGGPMESVREAEKPRTAVTIQVQGSYFETEQTKTRLVEMIREATDYTDFAYKQIGQR